MQHKRYVLPLLFQSHWARLNQGLSCSIIDDIQCSLQDCFVPDFLEVTQRCHDECLNHCILEAKENLVIYLVLLLIIVFVLAGIVYYFETLIHRKRRRF